MLKKILTMTCLFSVLPSSTFAASRYYVLDFATLNPPNLSSNMKDSRNPNDNFKASGNLELNDDTHIATRTLKLCLNTTCTEKTERYAITGYAPGTSAVFLKDQTSGTNHSMVFIWNYFNLGFMETLPNTWGNYANQNIAISWKDNNTNGGGNGGGNNGSNDNAPKYEDVVSTKFHNILTKELGMNIYTDNNPPLINGTYKMDPHFVKKSNYNDNAEGKNIGTSVYKFLNQNSFNSSIDVNVTVNYNSYLNYGENKFAGQTVFIGGTGNYFTVVFHAEGETKIGSNISRYKSLKAISGELDKDSTGKIKGIKNFQYGTLMLDDYGDKYDRLIPVGTGRLHVDEYATLQ